MAVPTASITAQPASIQQKKAEVAQLEAQLAEIDARAARAAEAYNGARWQQQQIAERIVVNTRKTTDTKKRLEKSQDVLASRLRLMYANPDPTFVEIVASSGSVVTAMDGAEILERVGERDGRMVRAIRTDLQELKTVRAQLEIDRAQITVKVKEAEAHRDEVLAVLNERQRVLDGARGELRQMVAAERARQRRIEEQRKQAVLAAQRAAAARQASTPSAPAATPSSPSAPVPQTTAGPAGDTGQQAVSIALSYLGVPYVWGGASPSGFDCSGLASYVYGQLGISVPHYTGAIWAAFPQVATGDLQPGDLVFFYSDLHHMGMYIGNGNFIHAPHTGDVVKITPLSERSDSYAGAVRPY